MLFAAALLASGIDVKPDPHRKPETRREICPGATHFYADWEPPPYWARDMRVVCRIGHHTFMAPKPRHHHDRGTAAKD